MSKVGVIVPTLGTRQSYLRECLRSIRANDEAYVNLVAPKEFDSSPLFLEGLIDSHTLDSGGGLPRAINDGFAALPQEIKLCTWLGDDDLLEPGSLRESSSNFQPGTVAVFGDCRFIDEYSEEFWLMKSGQWAVSLQKWGPNKVPQPGSIFLREAVEKAGFLDESLGWAFDQDLFMKLRKLGKVQYIPHTLASFRWHDSSLSAGSSEQSLREAAGIRVRHGSKRLKSLIELREKAHIYLALRKKSKIDMKKTGKL
jgi:hypothetical protein